MDEHVSQPDKRHLDEAISLISVSQISQKNADLFGNYGLYQRKSV